MRKGKGLWKKIILILLPLGVLGAMALLDPHVTDIGGVLSAISPFWFLAAAGSMLLYYFFDTVMYQLACRHMGTPQKFGESLLTTMLGFFYSALTPFSSGGQPMQVLQMRRRGMRVGTATSVLMMKFLAWQLVITLLGVIGLVALSNNVVSQRTSILVMFAIGFAVYAGSVAIALLAFLRPDWLHRAGEGILNFLERRHILKNQERILRAHAVWARTIADFREAVQLLLKRPMGMLGIFLAAVLEAFAYMSVTYFLYRGLGFAAHGLFHVVLLQSLLYICVSFVPLPGASIASEGGFYMVFSELFSAAARFPAVLLWRLITYYSALLLGLAAVMIDGFRRAIPAVRPAAAISPMPADSVEDLKKKPAASNRRLPEKTIAKKGVG